MKLNGTIFMIISAVCFGLAAPAAKIAYGEGASPVFVLALRFSMAALILWCYKLVFDRKNSIKVTKKQLFFLFLSGGIANFATTILYFSAIIYIPVSLHVIVFNIYPFLINLFSFVVLKERISKNQVVALGIGFIGIIMMVWGPGIYINMFGIILSLLAAMCNSGYVLMMGNESVKGLDSITVTTYIATFAAVSFILSGFLTNQLLLDISLKGIAAILFIAVFTTVVATSALYLGVKKIGASKASIVGAIEPVAGAFVGILFLNEKLVFMQVVGAALIIIAVIFVNLKKKNSGTSLEIV